MTLSNATTFGDGHVEAWAASLGGGVRLDQLVVSPSGARYLFVLATAKAIMDLLALDGLQEHEQQQQQRHLLAAQPFPPELKVSPRVADPAALETAAAAAAGVADGSLDGPSTSMTPSGTTTTAPASDTDGGAETGWDLFTTLHIQTLNSGDSGDSGDDSEAREARRVEGLERIRAALGLLPVSSPPTHPSHHYNRRRRRTSSTNNDTTILASAPTTCSNCTVEAAGDGAFVVGNLPLPIAGAAAGNISKALSSALVIDLARPFRLLNKQAAYLIQSGTNASRPEGGTPLWAHNLTGATEIIGVADSGLDHGSCFFQDTANPVVFQTHVRGVWFEFGGTSWACSNHMSYQYTTHHYNTSNNTHKKNSTMRRWATTSTSSAARATARSASK